MALLEKKTTETKKIHVQTTQCVYNSFWLSLFTQCLFWVSEEIRGKKSRLIMKILSLNEEIANNPQ